MKLRSLYILSIVGLLLVIVVQIGGMMYAYDNTKKEAERALNECFRLAFIETVDNEINNLPFPDMTIPFYSYLSKDSIRSFEDEMFLNYQQAASFLEDVYHVAIPLDVMARLVEKKLKWKKQIGCMAIGLILGAAAQIQAGAGQDLGQGYELKRNG